MQFDRVYPEPLHLTRFFSHMRFFDQKNREKPHVFTTLRQTYISAEVLQICNPFPRQIYISAEVLPTRILPGKF